MAKGQKKAHKKFRSEDLKSTTADQNVHFDVVGPIEPPTLAGNKWILNAIDDHDDWTESYPLKLKSKVHEGLEGWCASHPDPKAIRSDNAREFRGWNTRWRKFCRERKIKTRFSVPFEPEGNGKIERANRTLTDGLRAVITGVDKRLWGYGSKVVSHVWNRTDRRHKKSPYFRKFKKEPKTDYFRVFGCLAFSKLHERTKLQSKYIPGVFLGYSDDCAGYLIGHWTKNNRFETIISYAPKFFEDILVEDVDVLKYRSSATLPDILKGVDISPSQIELPGLKIGDGTGEDPPKRGRGRPRKLQGSAIAKSAPSAKSSPVPQPAPKTKSKAQPKAKSKPVDPPAAAPKPKAKVKSKSAKVKKQDKKVKIDDKTKAKVKDAKPKNKAKRTAALPAVQIPVPKLVSQPAAQNQNIPVPALPARFINPATGQFAPTRRVRGKRPISEILQDLTDAEDAKRRKTEGNTAEVRVFWATVEEGEAFHTHISQRQAFSGEDADLWHVSDKAERTALEEKETWDVISRSDLLPTDKVIPIACLYTYKDCGRRKTRSVVLGNRQNKHDVDCFSPTVGFATSRMCMVKCASEGGSFCGFDISNAFVNAKIPPDQRVVCKLPKHWGGDYVLLKKSLYGLRQAPRNWYDCFRDALVNELGWTGCIHDPGLFSKEVNGRFISLCIYVDDGLLCGDKELIEAERELILKRFKGRKEEPERDGDCEIRTILGVKVSYNLVTREISFSQTHAILKVLDKFGMRDCKSARTPGSNFKNEGKLVDSRLYRSMVGSMMYIGTQTRPDTAHAIQLLSRHLTEPRSSALSAARRLMRYLKSTKDYCISFCPKFESKLTAKYKSMLTPDTDADTTIMGFADADFAPETTPERRSTSGNLALYKGCPIWWTSSVQKCISTSTAEAEYVALYSLVKMSVFINNVAQFVHRRKDDIRIPIFEDNAACVKMARASITSRRSKHIDTKYHFIRDMWKQKRIEVVFCPTTEQLADPLTKYVPRACGLKLVTTHWLDSPT